ncbi:hypothetical protein ACH9EU_10590 [Kocuria sp. M1R5S2]|uniref:hypothetical protein n=1 Tax=Kocuria rhizosphaerae TaxID=3376285 RepID=UPI0037BA4350
MHARPEGWVQLGLRGIFRKNTDDGTTHRETARPDSPPAAGPAGEGGALGDPQETDEPRALPADAPLAALVDRLSSRGAERAVLTLVQRGNTMTHQTEHSVGDGVPSVESGTVDQDSPLFDPVADLYSEAMSSPRGAWQTARVEVGPERDGARPVVTTFGFPDGSESVETWRAARSGQAAPASGAAAEGEQHAPENAGDLRAGSATAVGADGDREALGAPSSPATGAVPVVAGTEGAAGASDERAEPDRGVDGRGDVERGEDDRGDVDRADVDGADVDRGAGGPAAEEPSARREATAEDEAHGVPDHVDHEEWHEDTEPPAPTGAAAAAAAAVAAGTTTGDEHDDSAPETAVSTDVSPSYKAPEAPSARPSGDRLAPGNLVLKEADVLRRLAGAQRRLFGPDGSAMDVSTVLVRVRTLGTYYDALTHVRKNGFWDQRRTFDLVPEELLHVQELKDQSYVEGAGAPLAMMFRFRPGIPPEVSFDYADEEAFVRYEQRLPGQNYLEELRMYPRTGANIPQHMNEALQDWNY